MPRVKRIGTLTVLFLYVTALVLVSGWWHEYRSCERHNVLIPALHQYPLDAAVARTRSAAHEALRDPVQALIDREAAAAFRGDAARTLPLACFRVVPATH